MEPPYDERDSHKLSGVQSPSTFDKSLEPPAKIATVFNSEFAEAKAKTNLHWYSWTSIQLYLIVFIGFVNGASNGFDGSLMGGINAMPQYLKFFGYETTGATTGIVFMIYTVGTVSGALFAGPLAEWKGRRAGMFIGGILILLGAAVITSAQNASAFLGGRFVLGFGVAISTTAAPTWVIELAPPQWRGRIGGVYNCFFFIGAIPATGVMVGSSKIQSTWSWRLPLILQIVPPIIVMTFVWLCPESPRWLVSRGRTEEAREILLKYHGNYGESNAMIELQLKEFEREIEIKHETSLIDYSMLFNTKNARWRMLVVFLMCWNGQLAGNGLITYYLPVMFANTGVKSTQRKLVLNFANSILQAGGAFMGASLTDKLDRRPRLYFGSILLAGLLGAVTGLTGTYGHHGNKNIQGANASIAFIFLFGFAYAFIYTPLQSLYCAEVLNQRQRAKGMAVHILISNIAGFINTFANSVGLGRWGYKYYFVFVAWDLIASALWYLFGVETRGRTLEELDEVFNQPWPAMASRQKVAIAVRDTGDIEVLEKEAATL